MGQVDEGLSYLMVLVGQRGAGGVAVGWNACC